MASLAAASVTMSILAITYMLVETRNRTDRKKECAKKATAKIIQPMPPSGKSKPPSTAPSVKVVAAPISQGRLLEK
jgi:hypothetical protein